MEKFIFFTSRGAAPMCLRIAIRILSARDQRTKGWAGNFYRTPKEEFSGTVEIVSYLHVQGDQPSSRR
jgi:hypothetical protein